MSQQTFEFSILNYLSDKNPKKWELSLSDIYVRLGQYYDSTKLEFNLNKGIKPPRIKRIIGSVFKVTNNRKTENILYTTLVILDVDTYNGNFNDLKADIKVELEGINYILYSTGSCTYNNPRCRIIIPLDNKILPEQYKKLVLNFLDNIKNTQIKNAINADLSANITVNKVFALPYYNHENTEHEDVHTIDYINSGRYLNPTNYIEQYNKIEHIDNLHTEVVNKEEFSLVNIKPPVDISEADIIKIINQIQVDKIEYNAWLKIGIALHHQYKGDEVGLKIWNMWSSKDYKRYKGYKELQAKWLTFETNTTNSYTFRSVINDYVSDAVKPLSTLVNRAKFIHTTGKTLNPKTTYENFLVLLKEYGVKIVCDVILKDNIGSVNNEIINDGNYLAGRIKSIMSANDLKTGLAETFIYMKALDNKINSWRDFILSKPWDKKCRLQEMYDTIGVDSKYKELKELFLYKWLVQMIHVTCMNDKGLKQARNMLIFKGNQGIGKTTWLLRLVPEEMSKYAIEAKGVNLNEDMGILKCIKYVFVEFGEIVRTFKITGNDGMKNFLSATRDLINKKYVPEPVSYNRHTVYFGSVNDEVFLTDQTGNSRFWVLPVNTVNGFHKIDLQQLYAQLYETCKNVDYNLTNEEMALSEKNNRQYLETLPIEELFKTNFNVEDKPCQWLNATEILKMCGYTGNVKKADRNIVVKYLLTKKKKFKRRANDGKFFVPNLSKRALNIDFSEEVKETETKKEVKKDEQRESIFK